jgi:hypothetical protein
MCDREIPAVYLWRTFNGSVKVFLGKDEETVGELRRAIKANHVSGTQPQRIPDVSRSLVAAANKILGQSDIRVGGDEISVNREGSLECLNALPGAIGEHLGDAQTKMSQRVLAIDSALTARASAAPRWVARSSLMCAPANIPFASAAPTIASTCRRSAKDGADRRRNPACNALPHLCGNS